jgi:anti-sigma factor RsiW
MRCAESLRVQAYFDGELDAPGAAEIERHVEHCAECSLLLQDLKQVRTALRQELTYEKAPDALRARIARALDQEAIAAPIPEHRFDSSPGRSSIPRHPRTFWHGAFAGVGGTAIAASLAFFLWTPPLGNSLPEDLVSAHVRSLMPDHLIDVVSTDKHTVKPWFAGHADVSPAVADFETQGYKLVGGRADYFDHQRAAVVVYRHGSHVINVFSWDASRGALPKSTTRDGYHLAFWRSGDLAYCAVSDAGWDELFGLAKLMQDLSLHENK